MSDRPFSTWSRDGADVLRRYPREIATFAAAGALLGAASAATEHGYHVERAQQLREDLELSATIEMNRSPFSLIEHRDWTSVAQGTLDRHDDRRSLASFCELLERYPDRMSVLEVSIKD